MKIIKPSAEEFKPENPLQHIERCGRVCYKSEDKITQDSAEKFVAGIVKRGHLSVTEHFRYILEVGMWCYRQIMALHPKHLEMSYDGRYLISGSSRGFIDLYNSLPEETDGRWAVMECINSILKGSNCSQALFPDFKPVDYGYVYDLIEPRDLSNEEELIHGWHTIKFICDRGVTHELVRHRPCSFSQESTRYCVAGDMKLTTSNPHEHLTVKEFYEKSIASHNGAWKRIRIRQYDEISKELTYCKVNAVVYNGAKQCVKIKTKLGYELECTLDHLVLSEHGYEEAGFLAPGNKIMVNGTTDLYKNKDWLYHQNIELDKTFVRISKEFGINVSTLKKWARKFGLPKKGTGYFNVGHVPFNKGLHIPTQIEALKKYHHCGRQKDTILKQDTTKYQKHADGHCMICGSTENLHVHHLDKNHKNNNPENLVTLCAPCHGRVHSQNLMTAYLDEIVSIESTGEKGVYDISVDSSSHNFVANGVVVHNCNYNGDKFGNEITVIDPCFWDENDPQRKMWLRAMNSCETMYLDLIAEGASPQEARSVLPNSLKTELVMTCTNQEWLHVLKLRCSKAAHPQAREVCDMALKILKDQDECGIYGTL